MSRPHRFRKVFIVAVSTISLLFIPVFTQRASANVTASYGLVARSCTSSVSPLRWSGGIPSGPDNIFVNDQPRGTVVICATKYKAIDLSATSDWWVGEVTSTWTMTAGVSGDIAPMSHFISSNKSPIFNDYGTTPSFTASSGCTNLSVGLNIGWVGASASNTICQNTVVSRNLFTTTAGNWVNSTAGRLRTVQTQYGEQVTAGVVPTFSLQAVIPQYTVNPCPAGTALCSASYTVRNTIISFAL
jgi:hypothetical protein